MDNYIETFKDKNEDTMALLIKAEHSSQGIEFLTKNEDYMQVAYMGHPADHIIIPHYHNKIERTVDLTCETLIMRKGVMEVSLYEDKIVSHIFLMKKGDVLTLFRGGHSFRMIEDVEMIEIKQGPFLGSEDKTRF